MQVNLKKVAFMTLKQKATKPKDKQLNTSQYFIVNEIKKKTLAINENQIWNEDIDPCVYFFLWQFIYVFFVDQTHLMFFFWFL